MNTKYDVVIVGAGVTGLTIAYYLSKSGLNVCLLEKESRVGGVISTIRNGEFFYEIGPNSGILSSYEAYRLFESLKPELQIDIARDASNSRWILKDGKCVPLPSSILNGITTPLFTFRDKLNLLLEPFREKGHNPNESVKELTIRRMGKSFFEYAINPFISGIYAGDPSKLITKYALPKLYNLEQNYGSFIKGALNKKFEKKDEKQKLVSKRVFSFKGGLDSLTKTLAKNINGDIFTSCSNVSLTNTNSPFSITYTKDKKNVTITADQLVTTINSHLLLEVLPAEIKHDCPSFGQMNYAKVAQVIFGFKKWNGIDLNAFGVLVPEVENREVLGILFSSSIFGGRAPKDGALLSIFIGGSLKPNMIELSDEQLVEIAKYEVKEILHTKDNEPDMIDIYRYEYAIPQYEISSGQRFKEIETVQEKFRGLTLAGNIRDGIGLSDRITQAVKVAEELIAKVK
ncbi:protoporphyrinogen oxidase [Candidatus Kapaibacterium sp.]